MGEEGAKGLILLALGRMLFLQLVKSYLRMRQRPHRKRRALIRNWNAKKTGLTLKTLCEGIST